MPSTDRSRINSRSWAAKPDSMVSISLPVAVAVSILLRSYCALGRRTSPTPRPRSESGACRDRDGPTCNEKLIELTLPGIFRQAQAAGSQLDRDRAGDAIVGVRLMDRAVGASRNSERRTPVA